MFSAVYFPMAVTGWGQECTNTEMRNSKEFSEREDSA